MTLFCGVGGWFHPYANLTKTRLTSLKFLIYRSFTSLHTIFSLVFLLSIFAGQSNILIMSNQAPQPTSTANLIDEFLKTICTFIVSIERNVSRLNNGQKSKAQRNKNNFFFIIFFFFFYLVTAVISLLLLWLLGPALVNLAISILYFVILLAIATVLVFFACRLPSIFDETSPKSTVTNHYHGPILQVVRTLISLNISRR